MSNDPYSVHVPDFVYIIADKYTWKKLQGDAACRWALNHYLNLVVLNIDLYFNSELLCVL